MKVKQLFEKVFINTALGSIIVSILLPSCSSYLVDEYNSKDNIYGEFAKDEKQGNLLADVNALEFSDTFREYSRIIVNIIQDVITNKSSADLFCSDPDAYLAEKNYAISIKLTEREKSIIKALTDEDIRSAAQRNDLKLFLTLCKQKGYLSIPAININTENFDYSKFFNTEDDYLKYRQIVSAMYSKSTDVIVQNSAYEEAFEDTLVAAVLVIAYVGAAVGIVVVAWVELWVFGAQEDVEDEDVLAEQEPVLKLWTKESSGKLDYDMLRSELIIKTADDYVAAISTEISGVKAEALKEFIVINLEKYYGLKK